MLTKELKVTPEQATGGAGSLFALAKERLKPDQFSKVSAAVPGMEGFHSVNDMKKTSRKKEDCMIGIYFSAWIGRITVVIPLYCSRRWIAKAVSCAVPSGRDFHGGTRSVR
jgi:hypothetical protein